MFAPCFLHPLVHTTNDSPHPQLRLALGFTTLNPDDISSSA
jgi:hypothetical protein